MVFTKISQWRVNKNASGSITAKDESDILTSLNNQIFCKRTSIYEILSKYETDSVIQKLEREADTAYNAGYFNEQVRLIYPQNCHTLVEEFKKTKGWQKISGYLINKEDLEKTSIKLISHSVSKDAMNRLIETTGLYDPKRYNQEFIEHQTGSYGIDLTAS